MWILCAISGVNDVNVSNNYKAKGQRNKGRPKRYWQRDQKDWVGESVGLWRVGRTAEVRLMEALSKIHQGNSVRKRITEFFF